MGFALLYVYNVSQPSSRQLVPLQSTLPTLPLIFLPCYAECKEGKCSEDASTCLKKLE